MNRHDIYMCKKAIAAGIMASETDAADFDRGPFETLVSSICAAINAYGIAYEYQQEDRNPKGCPDE